MTRSLVLFLPAFPAGSNDLGWLAVAVARIALTNPVDVIEPAELADTVKQLATHLTISPP